MCLHPEAGIIFMMYIMPANIDGGIASGRTSYQKTCQCTIIVVQYIMGFKDIRQEAISAIEEGRIQHEARDEVDEKNLLLTGDVSAKQVIRLLRLCRGDQYTCSPHHLISNIEVHVFKPYGKLESQGEKRHWYIKFYFLEPDVWFISVHERK
jgi:hypothetical protein